MNHERLNLHLFDGAAAAVGQGAGEGAQGSSGGESTAAAARNSNPLAGIRYGIQAEEGQAETKAAEGTPEAPAEEAPAPEESFENLIKGKYKNDFNNRVQQIINQRFKNHKELQESVDRAAPLMDFLAKYTGKDTGDYEGIQAALMDDDAIFEAQAMRNGQTTSEYKAQIKNAMEQDRVKRENNALRAQLEMQQQQERDAQAIRQMNEEAAEVKKVFDSFDLPTEMQNPKFVEFMRKGLGMMNAYKMAHYDDIMQNSMHYTAQKVQEQVTNSIKAKSSRPAENGIAGRASSTVKADVSKLTKADRDEIARRVRNGERVTFG